LVMLTFPCQGFKLDCDEREAMFEVCTCVCSVLCSAQTFVLRYAMVQDPKSCLFDLPVETSFEGGEVRWAHGLRVMDVRLLGDCSLSAAVRQFSYFVLQLYFVEVKSALFLTSLMLRSC
jgi:hypothetical protein